jgi:hypothetical protein
MRITEEMVFAAASQWADKHGKNPDMVASSVLDAIAVLKETFSGDKYMDELEKLYLKYAAG